MCQPIDVGIGKPLKTRCRHLWEEWMVEEVTNNPTVACRPASRLQMSEWIHMFFNKLKDSNIGYISWRHHDYSYFPNEPAARAATTAPAAADIGLFEFLEAEGDISDNMSDNGSSDESNISSDEGGAATATGAATPLTNVGGTVAAAAPQPEQQPVRRCDPGWDNIDDSNYVPGASESE